MPLWYKIFWLGGRFRDRQSRPCPWARSTAVDLGEVDDSTLGPCAFLSSDNLALSMVDLACSAHLTFLDLYEHRVNVFIWAARGALAHLCPYSFTVLSMHNSASLCTLSPRLFKHNWALQCQPNKTAVWHLERRRPNPLCPPNRENLNCWLKNNILSKGSVTSRFW